MNDHYDSIGRPIFIGDRVKFRGKWFTIKKFKANQELEFVEHIEHTREVPNEITVDLAMPNESNQ